MRRRDFITLLGAPLRGRAAPPHSKQQDFPETAP
jgi:hypothetical protein